MRLTSLSVTDVRNIRTTEVTPGPGFNLFYGANGAGKTSLLESIAILSTGRSFRAGKISTVIRSNSDFLTVSAEIANEFSPQLNRIGIQRGQKETLVRINGENVKRISALAKALPCIIVSTRNHELIEGGPAERRSFIDWLLFHVEPESLNLFQRYRNALQQRNAALRSNASDSLVSMWHPELVETGQLIDAGRRKLLERFNALMDSVLIDWPESLHPSFQYRAGWTDGVPLEEALARMDQCRRRGITSVGPHRADIVIKSGTQEARYILSRGQQKLLAAKMRLAQSDMYSRQHGHSPVVLFDDLPSELDSSARDEIFQYLSDRGVQVFLTSVDDVSKNLHKECDLFHVEQGKVEKMVY